jgi:hypothetical protein
MSGQSNAQVYAELSSKLAPVARSAREILAEDQTERERQEQHAQQQAQPTPTPAPTPTSAPGAVEATGASASAIYCECPRCGHCGKVVR